MGECHVPCGRGQNAAATSQGMTRIVSKPPEAPEKQGRSLF